MVFPLAFNILSAIAALAAAPPTTPSPVAMCAGYLQSAAPGQTAHAEVAGPATSTSQYVALIQRALERRALSAETIERLTTQDTPVNPLTLEQSSQASPAEQFALKLGFERLLKSGLEWDKVKDETARLLSGAAAAKQKREQAKGETKPIFAAIPISVKSSELLKKITLQPTFAEKERPQPFKLSTGERVKIVVDDSVVKLVNLDTKRRKTLVDLSKVPEYQQWISEIRKAYANNGVTSPSESYYLIEKGRGEFDLLTMAGPPNESAALRINAKTKAVTLLDLPKGRDPTFQYWQGSGKVLIGVGRNSEKKSWIELIDPSVGRGKLVDTINLESRDWDNGILGIRFHEARDGAVYYSIEANNKFYLGQLGGSGPKLIQNTSQEEIQFFEEMIPFQLDGKDLAVIGATWSSRISVESFVIVNLAVTASTAAALGTAASTNSVYLAGPSLVLDSRSVRFFKDAKVVEAPDHQMAFLIIDYPETLAIDLRNGHTIQFPPDAGSSGANIYHDFYVDKDSGVVTVWGPVHRERGSKYSAFQIYGPPTRSAR